MEEKAKSSLENALCCIGCPFYDPDEGCLPDWESTCANFYDPLPWDD